MSDLSNIDIVILAGGLGKRLRGEIGESQKVMAKVDDQPFLDILLKNISQQGFKRAVLCTGYQAQALEDHYRSRKMGLAIGFSRESEPLGTGGALKNAMSMVKSDPFIAMNGDSFCEVDLKAFLEFHKANKTSASIVVSKVKDRRDFGTITLDQDKRVIGFNEKVDGAAPEWVNAGVYCFNRSILDHMPQEKVFSLEKDLFPLLAERNLFSTKEFIAFEAAEGFLDIGTPERYKEAQKALKKEK